MEVCITSNLQTNPSIGAAQYHTIRKMLDNRLSVALCTDNRLVSHTTLTDEFTLAVAECGLTHRELRDVVIHSFKRSFYPGSYQEKRKYVRRVIDLYDATLRRFTEIPVLP
jgi:adenosine deaminase